MFLAFIVACRVNDDQVGVFGEGSDGRQVGAVVGVVVMGKGVRLVDDLVLVLLFVSVFLFPLFSFKFFLDALLGDESGLLAAFFFAFFRATA